MKRIFQTKRFKKKFLNLSQKDQLLVQKTLIGFVEEPQHPKFRKHFLKGNLAGYQSIRVKFDMRIVFIEDDTAYYLFNIGTHEEVY